MSERQSPFEKHLGEIPQTQFVPKSPQDDQKNHIGGIFQKVEWGSGALVEAMLTS